MSPFTTETARAVGKKGVHLKKPTESVRRNKLILTVSDVEAEYIDAKAKRLSLSRTEFLVRAAKEYEEK
jgi:hypothetical protein